MSVKELKFECENYNGIHLIKFEDDDFIFEHNNHVLLIIDRTEAHLLMLFLQEHLV